MSTSQLNPVEAAEREKRRSSPRRRVDRLAYIRFDKDNGGILLDIGEGGLKFQGVASAPEGELCVVKFTLPGSGRTIEVRGQIAWSNKSRKGGGVRFVDLPEDALLQIREWMSQENVSLIPTRPAAKPVVSKPPIFHAREREKAGNSWPLNQPVMPTLNAAPVVAPVPVAAEVPVAEAPSIAPLPVKLVPAAGGEALNIVLESAAIEVATAVSRPALPEASGPAEFERVAEPADTMVTAHVAKPELVAESARAGAGSNPAKFPRAESFLAAELGVPKEVRPSRGFRVAQMLMVAASVCVVALAAVVITPRGPALLASFQGTSQADTSSVAAPVAASSQDFKVDVVDGANRRWTLQNGDNDVVAAPTTPADSANAAVAQPIETDRIAVARSKNRRVKSLETVESSPIVRHLDLQPPKSRQAAQAQAGLDAPPVADGVPTANLDPRAVAAVPPPLPAPPPSQPAAIAKTEFRPAVLIHSVRAAYPQSAGVTNSGGIVRVSATVDKDGVPASLKVLSGNPQLSAAAFAAIRQWRYDPALLNGEPTESTVVITVNFQSR